MEGARRRTGAVETTAMMKMAVKHLVMRLMMYPVAGNQGEKTWLRPLFPRDAPPLLVLQCLFKAQRTRQPSDLWPWRPCCSSWFPCGNRADRPHTHTWKQTHMTSAEGKAAFRGIVENSEVQPGCSSCFGCVWLSWWVKPLFFHGCGSAVFNFLWPVLTSMCVHVVFNSDRLDCTSRLTFFWKEM